MLVLGASIALLALFPWLVETFFFRKNLLLLAWWALLPLSVGLDLGGTRLNLPSELMLLGWLALPVLRGLPAHWPLVLRHPVSFFLMVDVLIYFLATLTSTIPEVSLKRFCLHTAYIGAAYFLTVPALMQRKTLLKMGPTISLGLIPVLLAVLVFLADYHFNSEVAPAAPRPFFSDHTQFGAFAAFLLPLSFVLWHYAKSFALRPTAWQKALFPLLLTCVVLSFSRAVWLSTAVMAVLFFLIQLKIPFRAIMVFVLIGMGVLFSYSEKIYQKVLQNEAESDRQEVFEQLKSVGNLKTDVSNLERINRWKSAYKMFGEKPLLGFGPGTYQFRYAPYQELRDKTVISTNFGDAGNAHSEYLMYLAETGIFGFLNFLLLCLYLVYTGFRLVYTGAEPITKHLSLGILIGLCGFLTHSLVNSFLETDKIGLLFYFFVAALVALDLRDRMYKSA